MIPSTALQKDREARLFSLMFLDFTSILLSYNLPREEARSVALRAIEPVREHFEKSGIVLRRSRL